MRWIGIAALLTLSALAFAACGGTSKQDQALSQVCDARASISKQANALKGMSVADIASGKASDTIRAIGDDLQKIGDAQGDLASARKSEVEAANKKFTQQMQTIAKDLAATGNTANAATSAKAALSQIAAAYKDTFGLVDCSGS